MLFGDAHTVIVPATAFEVEAADEGTILGHLDVEAAFLCFLHTENLLLVICGILLIDELELELQSIDLNLVLPCVVL